MGTNKRIRTEAEEQEQQRHKACRARKKNRWAKEKIQKEAGRLMRHVNLMAKHKENKDTCRKD
jgi:hypothetical protein